MRACVNGNQHDRALAFLEEMLKKNLPVDSESFAVGVCACVGLKRADRALELWRETMPSVGVQAHTHTLTPLLQLLLKAKDIESVKEVIGGLPTQTQTDTPTPTQGDAVLVLAQVAQAHALELPGDVCVYVIKTLLDAGRVGEALRLCGGGGGEGKKEGGQEGEGEIDEEETNTHTHTHTQAQFYAAVTGEKQEASVVAFGSLLNYRTSLQSKLTDTDTHTQTKHSSSFLDEELEEQVKNDKELTQIRDLCENNQLDEAITYIQAQTQKGQRPRLSVVNLVMEYAVVIYRDVAAAKKILEIPGAG
jgi:pentatricopeptide repeat protein